MEIAPQPGMPLSQMSRAAMSWNYLSAGLGLAAINAAFNSEEFLQASGLAYRRMEYQTAIDHCGETIANKRAAFIEFPVTIDTPLLKHTKASILKQSPGDGDFPISAAEYILLEQDYIFISGACIINKTLPRLLALTAGKPIMMAGPDVPAGLLSAEENIGLITFVVTQPEQCVQMIKCGASDKELYQTGYFIYAQK